VTQRLYDELASWWPLLSSPDDYAEEAAFYTAALKGAAAIPLRNVIELGSGGGNNASHMKSHFHMTLVEPSRGMIDVSQRLNPECEHHQGDMRTVRLGREFDGVFIHDAISYMTTVRDLRLAMDTAFAHCRPGGGVVVAPDFTTETFAPSTECGGHDGDGRAMRYLEWCWDPDPTDTQYIADYAFVLREGHNARVVHDRHIEGLFPAATWLETMRAAGFEAWIQPFTHSEVDRLLHVFAGRRPAA
jgi:trans-aconitate methyltransferase